MTEEIKQKIEKYGAMAIQATAGTGLFPSVALGQAILETGWFKSRNANNLFGIKAGSRWSGRVISSGTWEMLSSGRQYFKGTGKTYPNKAAAVADGAHERTIFRAYDSEQESFNDWVKLITELKRYQPAMKKTTPEEQIKAIDAGGYATGTNYAYHVLNVIRSFNLTDLDKKKS